MALLLKSTKFIHDVIGLTRQRGLPGRGKKAIFCGSRNICVSSTFRTRAAVSLDLKDTNENDNEELNKSIFYLNKNLQIREIFTESVKDVMEIIKQKGKITNSQLMLLLKCCGEVSFMSPSSERIQMAEEIWNTAEGLGMQFNTTHYDTLLRVFLENNHIFSPSEFLDILEQKGLEPNILTYKRILKAYCQQGDIKGANDVLKKMKQLNYPISEEDFNSLIQCHCKIGDLEQAASIIKIMQERDIDPTSKTYINLLCGYAQRGEIDKLKTMLEELPEKDVYLSGSNVLEIMCALATNGHSEHMDLVLRNLNNDLDTAASLAKIIHRLLHDKLDSVALKIFEKVVDRIGLREATRQGRYILRHFAMYRSPEEALDMCKQLEEKGWVKCPTNFILKEYFLNKDEHLIIDLLRAMESRNMEIRRHYYWPAIIKASKKGQSEMLKVIGIVPRDFITKCPETAAKVILPNFHYGKDWRQDYETLKNIGIKRSLLGFTMFSRLLTEGRLTEAEKIAATLPVSHLDSATRKMTHFLLDNPGKENSFVNVIYHLAHDGSMISNVMQSSAEEEAQEERTGDANLFDVAVTSLLRFVNDEGVVRRVLEGMLEKKMHIDPKKGHLVTSSFSSQDIADVVKKLTDPGLRFRLNQNIIRRKYGSASLGPKYSDVFQELSLDQEANVKILSEEMGRKTTSKDCINFIQRLLLRQNYYEGVKLIEKMAEREDLDFGSHLKDQYRPLLYRLCYSKDMNLIDKAFDLGVKIGILNMDDYVPVLQRLLFREGMRNIAMDKYVEHLGKKKSTGHGFMDFLMKAVAEGNEEYIRKLSTALMERIPEDKFMSFLSLAFARDGQLKKAKRILDSNKAKLTEGQFYRHCESVYEWTASATFENYLALVKDLEFFDRVPLYQCLLMKYAQEGKVDSAKQLWLVIEEDDISDYGFLEKMREFMNDPTLENLENLSKKEKSELFASVSIKKFLAKNGIDKAYKLALSNTINQDEARLLIQKLAYKGKLEEVLELSAKYRVRNSEIATAFLTGGNVDKYLEFINRIVNDKRYRSVSSCFNVGTCLKELSNEDSIFEKYKSLAIRCYEAGGVKEALNSYFVTCLRIPSRVTEAGEIFDLHHRHFSQIEFHEIYTIGSMHRKLDFLENLISVEKIKSHFSHSLPTIYGKIIKENCEKERVNRALDFLNQAVAEGVANRIESKSIKHLAKKLQESGKRFPHDELLRSKS